MHASSNSPTLELYEEIQPVEIAEDCLDTSPEIVDYDIVPWYSTVDSNLTSMHNSTQLSLDGTCFSLESEGGFGSFD